MIALSVNAVTQSDPRVAIDADLVSLDDMPGWKPAPGGLRHLTWLVSRPPDRTVVKLVCGDIYEVGSRRDTSHEYDCHACAAAYLGIEP